VFGNAVPRTNKTVAVSVGDGTPITLNAPFYKCTVEIAADFVGDVLFDFTLDGTHIADSPVTMRVEPRPLSPLVLGGVAMAIALVGLFVFFEYRKRARKAEEEAAALEVERNEAVRNKNEVQFENEALASENLHLEEALKMQKHSEMELVAMRKVMDEQQAHRKDELSSVLVDSSELEIKSLLGQGGMGKVRASERAPEKCCTAGPLARRR
jgi:hypothetical protein